MYLDIAHYTGSDKNAHFNIVINVVAGNGHRAEDGGGIPGEHAVAAVIVHIVVGHVDCGA